MADSKLKLPSYEEPPVIEVACGIVFEPLNDLLVPHFGLLWERFRKEYPQCQEVPPLAAAIESFEEARGQRLRIEVGTLPPLPRVWFQHETGSGLIQLQRDRFHYNWRKFGPADAYPRFENVIENFRQHFDQLESFLRENNLSNIRPVQYELTYINHIEQKEAMPHLSNIGITFPDFSWRSNKERFLPDPEAVHWQTIFPLPDQAGRLHITINNGKRVHDKKAILNLEITARGIPAAAPKDKMWHWFDLAHEWIVQGFTDLTSNSAQKEWKRLK